MKVERLLGAALIAVATFLLAISFDVFERAWAALVFPDYPILKSDYFAIFGQAILYLMTYVIAVLLGIRLIKGKSIKKRSLRLVAVIVVWFILELPMYHCEFYERNHSFWFSKSHHLH